MHSSSATSRDLPMPALYLSGCRFSSRRQFLPLPQHFVLVQRPIGGTFGRDNGAVGVEWPIDGYRLRLSLDHDVRQSLEFEATLCHVKGRFIAQHMAKSYLREVMMSPSKGATCAAGLPGPGHPQTAVEMPIEVRRPISPSGHGRLHRPLGIILMGQAHGSQQGSASTFNLLVP